VVEVQDNQPVRAGDVLFRIDDRDYRARLAQAVANVDAAQARITNVDAEVQLQHALIRQAEAQRLASVAEMNLARKASDRRRELIRTNAVSQAQVDESDAALSKAEAAVAAAVATIEAQKQRIAVLASQREAAVAAVAQAEAARDLAQIDLDNTVVHAPVDGVIGNPPGSHRPPCRARRLPARYSFRSGMCGSWRISRKRSRAYPTRPARPHHRRRLQAHDT